MVLQIGNSYIYYFDLIPINLSRDSTGQCPILLTLRNCYFESDIQAYESIKNLAEVILCLIIYLLLKMLGKWVRNEKRELVEKQIWGAIQTYPELLL
jgi:hypothetical protein